MLPIPLWYFADFYGKPLGGGFMQAWSSLDHTAPKIVFQDSGGTNAWPTQTVTIGQVQFPNAILFNANGEQGPFFWEFDSNNANDLYFLQIYDSDGNIQFSINNYGGPGSGGGGGTINNFSLNENYITNNVFWRNNGTLSNIQSGTVVCPSNHEGFQYSDIQFIRSNNTATDAISFGTFGAGNVPLTGDVTPEYYLDSHCTVAGGETSKVIRFPVDLHVKNLEQQTMTAMIWAKGISGNVTFAVQFRQSFGTGSGTADVVTNCIPSTTATNSWALYGSTGTFIIPSVAGKVVGNGGDDASYLEIVLPAGGGSEGEIQFAKPKLYLAPSSGLGVGLFAELDSYDEVDTIINSPRTGDVRTSMSTTGYGGWVAMNDGTIGSASSNATTRANIDTWQLYNLLWSATTNTALPSFTSAGVLSTRGADAITDFGNNVQLALPKALGRVLAGANPTNLGVQKFFTASDSAGTLLLTIDDTSPFFTGVQVTFTNTGGALPTGLVAATQYWLTVVNGTTLKVSTTLANALAETPVYVAWTDNGSGTNSFTTTVAAHALGAFIGEDTHALTIAEMPAHDHPGSYLNRSGLNAGFFAATTANQSAPTPPNGLFIASQGGSTAHNILQPTTYVNYYIKL